VLFGGIYGTLFHIWQGRTLRQLLLYLAIAIVGFALGHVAGEIGDLDVPTIGRLHVIEASLTSWLMLFIARRLKL
jgi:hypothetical protein